MHEPDSWRENIKPPPGGLARLVASVDAQRRAPTAHRWRAFAVAASVIVLALAFGIADYAHTVPQRRIRLAIKTALQTPTNTDIQVENGAALELPSSRSDVRIFRIAALPAAPIAQH